MSADMILTADELQALTGYRQSASQTINREILPAA